MPAHSETFPWPSYYGHYKFFEQQMATHSRVSRIKSAGQSGLYCLTRVRGSELTVFVCECYSFGLAEYDEASAALGHLDAIIINSNWCGYTMAVKRHCRKRKVGVFTIGEFMASLNRENYWEYLTEDQTDLFRENGWL